MPEPENLLVAVELDTTRLSIALQKMEREMKRSAARMSKSIAAAAEEVTAAFSAWEEIGEIVKGVHEIMKMWLVDKFSVVIAGVEDATGRIVALWRELRDELVENSIVPEMVGDIGNWFDRLPDLVGAPTEAATAKAAEGFERLGTRVGRAISEMIRTGEVKFRNFRNVLAEIAASVHKMLLQTFVFGPLSGFLGGMFGGGAALGAPAQQLTAAIQPLAHGGPAAAGLPLLVGERGPEIFVPSLAGTVLSNRQSRAALGGPTFFVDARGADVAAVQRLESFVAGLHGSLETRAVEAVANASARGRRFGFAT